MYLSKVNRVNTTKPASWRSQDIVLLRGLCARSNSLLSPPTRIAHTIALLSHDYCAIFDPPPTPHVYAIQHTIFGHGNIV